MSYTLETYIALLAAIALLIGVLLVPAALVLLIYEGYQELRSLPAPLHLPQRTVEVPAASTHD